MEADNNRNGQNEKGRFYFESGSFGQIVGEG